MSQLFNRSAFYDRAAPFYARAMGWLPAWRLYTEAVLPWVPSGGLVLELGPGPGLLLAKLASRSQCAIGVDFSTGMLQQAGRRLRSAQASGQLSQGDAARLPFSSDSFDAVVTTFSLSAIPDGQAAVDEMARVLRAANRGTGFAGGVLALVDACYPSDGNLAGTVLAKLWELGGDRMRDEAGMMGASNLRVIARREFGAFGSIRLVVARKE